ncbi:response regulator [Chitinophaga arvensicola]|uniref:Response regulator receiver domain-containing protein n=1 Tax=Chitinophaga arvensicola TaxID=29529 RepID=A0A1I0S9Z9_9BACT|nr:response regulator [Chitinophaga arvensicola]SEW53051.1 Response regulator receiver domain-containing protein [Chitinophaga arvensicola]
MTNTNTSTAAKQKILIVEDEGEMCLLINLLLDGKEMEVEHVQSLSEAVEYFQQQPPAIVLLDNRLPDGYGLDFISYIKEKYPATKIIMISGMDAAAKDVAIENGADTFLEKPFNKTTLYSAIEPLLN